MLHNRLWIVIGLSFLVLLLISCGTTPTPETVFVNQTVVVTREIEVTRIVEMTREVIITATPNPPTATPEPPTPTPAPPVIFEDDFSNPRSGWDTTPYEGTDRFYEDGQLHVRITEPEILAWTSNTELQSLDDFDLEVDATQIDGPNENQYGVLFRYQNVDNFYQFAITGDGYFALLGKVGGQFYNIVNFTQAAAVKPGMATNRLRVVANGNEFSLYVNGELMATVPDNSFRRGDISLVAGCFGEDDVHIAFDNLKVSEIR